MGWTVQIPRRGRAGAIKYEKHEFKTKKEAERFQNGLDVYSELFKVSYMMV